MRVGVMSRHPSDRRSPSPRRDPRKTDAGSDGATKNKTARDERPKPWLTRPWVEADGPCPHKDCKGSHWKVHCPKHPPSQPGSGQAKLASIEGHAVETNNEQCDVNTYDADRSLSFHDLVNRAFPDGVAYASFPNECVEEIDAPPLITSAARSCVAAVKAVGGALPTDDATAASGDGKLNVVQGTYVPPHHANVPIDSDFAPACPPIPDNIREMKLYLLLVGPHPGLYLAAPTGANSMMQCHRNVSVTSETVTVKKTLNLPHARARVECDASAQLDCSSNVSEQRSADF